MSLKKIVSLFLASTMLVTMLPSMTFAATTNKVSKVVSASEDDTIPSATLDIKVKSGSSWDVTQTISMSINNAEFVSNPKYVKSGSIYSGQDKSIVEAKYTDNNSSDGLATSVKITDVQFADDTSFQMSFTTYDSNGNECSAATDDTISIVFTADSLKATGDSGKSVTVTIDEMDSNITKGTYTIARIVTGGTSTTLKGTIETHPEGDIFEAAEIQIKETTMNSLSVGSIHVLKFTLPKDIGFSSIGEAVAFSSITGNLFENELTNSVPSDTDETAMAAGDYYLESNGRYLVAAFEIGGSAESIDSAVLTPIIKIKKSASTGDIKLSIKELYCSKGTSIDSASNIKIAAYGTEGVTISGPSSSEMPVVIAGQVETRGEELFWTGITLTESIGSSLKEGNTIDINLPEEAQIVSRYIDSKGGIRVSFNSSQSLKNASKVHNIDVNGVDEESEVKLSTRTKTTYLECEYEDGYTLADDTSEFSVPVPVDGMVSGKAWEDDKASTIKIMFPITVRADYTGDIVAKVTGKDFEDTEVTLAKAVAPVTVTTTVTPVYNGMQDQALADITIEEYDYGYIAKNIEANRVTFKLDTNGICDGYSFRNAKVNVTSGDIVIYDTDMDYDDEKQTMTFDIDGVSLEKSVIKISGVTLYTSRTLPYGEMNLELCVDKNYKGMTAGSVSSTDSLALPEYDALVDNAQFDDGDFGMESDVKLVSIPYINVIDPSQISNDANSTVNTAAHFYLADGVDNTYSVGDVTYEMDAQAFIDENNRTMVPVRYIAYALGLKDSDISYDAKSSTATISGSTNIVNITKGSNILKTSRSEITMDTEAVNRDGRLYVPVRYIAEALGASVSWDQSQKLITLTY